MAQIDSSIALNVKAPQFESAPNALARVLQVQGMQQEQELGRMKMDEYQRGIGEKNRLQSILAGGGDSAALRRGGFLKESMDLDKNAAEVTHKTSETTKNRAEIAAKKIALYRDAINGVNDRDAAIQYMTAMHADPDLKDSAISKVPLDQAIAQVPQDPAQFQEFKRRFTLGAEKFMQDERQRLAQVETGRHNVATEGLTARGQDVSVDNNKRSVGAQYAIAQSNRDAATTNASATRDAAQIRRDQDTEMKLSDDYRGQSKPFKEVADAYKTITTSLDKATTSPAATLAGATKFMKLLDPGSVVRESELGMALAATGVLDRAMNYHQTLLRGKVLTPKQAEDFKDIAGQIYKAAQEQQQAIDKDYKGKAETYKLRPDMVVQDLGQNKPVVSTAKPGAPAAIKTDAEYNALPSGALFVGPDGKQRRKP